MSPAIATIILRTFSACSCSRLRNESSSSLVRPSTIRETRPEPGLEVRDAHVGVLDGVVQERRLQGRRVQTQVGQDLGNRERMLDEVLARQALLALVVLGGEPVGARSPSGPPWRCSP